MDDYKFAAGPSAPAAFSSAVRSAAEQHLGTGYRFLLIVAPVNGREVFYEQNIGEKNLKWFGAAVKHWLKTNVKRWG